MKVQEAGVAPSSDIYFHTPSETARRMYFYLRCTGRYQCDSHYRVTRQSYSSYLLLYVTQGEGYAMMDGARVPLASGQLALLDCYQPHDYGTDTGWHILWCHFAGPLAPQYFALIQQSRQQVIHPADPYATARGLERIFAMAHRGRGVSEPLVSQHLTAVLTAFITDTGGGRQAEQSGLMEEVVTYIAEHMDQPLTVEALARRAALSPYHFIRVFKKETGYTPHAYLLNARVNAAKFHLRTTTLSLREIALRCGFPSESGFCTTFKRLTGRTPMTYRSSGTT